MSKRQLQISIVFLLSVVLLGIYISENYAVFISSYVLLCVAMLGRTLFIKVTLQKKITYMFSYISIMIFQIVFATLLTFHHEPGTVLFIFYLFMSTLLIPVPVIIECFFIHQQDKLFFLPSLQDFKAVAYAQFIYDKDKVKDALFSVEKARNVFSKKNLGKLSEQLQGQSSFRYVNNGSLTEDYFNQAYASLQDEHIYIVLTDSGSPASELISIFTQQKFNHVSLSFDADLHTIISYNGGEKLYPPGMNPEMIAWFCKKPDSAVLIYRLQTTGDQKRKMIEKIREINSNGSAYNLLGLVFKYSAKPNIMFCSQFVNQMLQYAGLAYLNKKSTGIRPSDFVELDYKRKLEFVREIKFL